ncbi:hypothetical protein MRB53_037455 [Persea americana]|nr:hypothetical protein MRB53_037455 [Persea americana]
MSPINTFISILYILFTFSSQCHADQLQGGLGVYPGFLEHIGPASRGYVVSVVGFVHRKAIGFANDMLVDCSTLSKQLRICFDVYSQRDVWNSNVYYNEISVTGSSWISTCSSFWTSLKASTIATSTITSSGSSSGSSSSSGSTATSSSSSGLAALPTSVDIYKVVVVPAIALGVAVVA